MAKRWPIVVVVLALAGAGGLGYWWSLNRLLPVPLASDAPLFTPANPDPGQNQAGIIALMPSGPGLHAFMLHQVGEPLVAHASGGNGWTGVLAESMWGSPNQRHWRLRVRQAVRLHDGHLMDARWALAVLKRMKDGPFQEGDARASLVDDRTFDLDFKEAWDLPAHLSEPGSLMLAGNGPHAVGTGPFKFETSSEGETYLVRFDGFRHGNAGVAELHLPEDAGLLEGHRWVQDMMARRYAWSVFPGKVEPDDMAKVRSAPYDPVRLNDGSVWFISRRMRRLHPNPADWSQTAVFGAWQADMDLPYDPR